MSAFAQVAATWAAMMTHGESGYVDSTRRIVSATRQIAEATGHARTMDDGARGVHARALWRTRARTRTRAHAAARARAREGRETARACKHVRKARSSKRTRGSYTRARTCAHPSTHMRPPEHALKRSRALGHAHALSGLACSRLACSRLRVHARRFVRNRSTHTAHTLLQMFTKTHMQAETALLIECLSTEKRCCVRTASSS
eukprot:6176098-Pleurochrysis_carterae.AAC.1